MRMIAVIAAFTLVMMLAVEGISGYEVKRPQKEERVYEVRSLHEGEPIVAYEHGSGTILVRFNVYEESRPGDGEMQKTYVSVVPLFIMEGQDLEECERIARDAAERGGLNYYQCLFFSFLVKIPQLPPERAFVLNPNLDTSYSLEIEAGLLRSCEHFVLIWPGFPCPNPFLVRMPGW